MEILRTGTPNSQPQGWRGEAAGKNTPGTPPGLLHRLPLWVGSAALPEVFTLHACICYLEKAMATHSSTLAWKIPWTEEPSSLQSMGSQRVGHDWVTSLHFLYALSPYPELTFKIRNWLFQSITRKSEIKLKKEEKTFTPRVHLEGHKITADGDYSHEIKRRLPLGRKVMTNLDNIFKSRGITLPTKALTLA